MDTLNVVLANSRRAAICAFAVLLNACGGGGGGAAAPEAGMSAMTAVPTPAGADMASQSAAGGASPVVVPSPPDMSIEPPPGTVVTPPVPDMSANYASTVTAVDTSGAAAPATAITVAAQDAVELPDGAVACQPGTCPAFAVNGSVTNTYGADDPSAAHAYMLPASGTVPGAYPDLGNLPTMVIPPLAITVGEAPQ